MNGVVLAMEQLNERLDAILGSRTDHMIRRLKREPTEYQHTSRTLIVLSGDVSDVDGFYGLAKYAQLDSDVLFIMNYPAFLGVDAAPSPGPLYYKEIMEATTKLAVGKGYSYATRDIIAATELNYRENPAFDAYKTLLGRYNIENGESRTQFFQALTDMAFFMAKTVWNEVDNASKGSLLFAVGGINSVNPFHATTIKNELFVYAKVNALNGFSGPLTHRGAKEGDVINAAGRLVLDPVTDPFYTKIYLDFAGSMAFFDRSWGDKLERRSDQIQACFIMGGVFTNEPPKTMPAIAGSMNRFSCATMNQFYHPANSFRFFKFLGRHSQPTRHRITTYTVCNNTVPDLKTTTDGKPTDDGWKAFLRGNNIDNPFLTQLASVYYNSPYKPPHKAFDYYTALALAHHDSGAFLGGTPKTLFYNPTYAATLVSPASIDTFKAAVADYASHIDLAPTAGDSAFDEAKKRNQAVELFLLSSETGQVAVPVTDLSFNLNPANKRLTLQRGG
jgi:hypothetical protein